MEVWVSNPGYPEVFVDRDYQTGAVTLKQNAAEADKYRDFFWPTANNNFNNLSKLVWSIPFTYTIGHDGNAIAPDSTINNKTIARSDDLILANQRRAGTIWLHQHSSTFADDFGLSVNDWLLANIDFQFLYRVNYDQRNWHLLIDQLHSDHSRISSQSRAQLIVDGAYFLKQNSHLTLYIRLLNYLRYEADLLPWYLAITEIEQLLATFRGSSSEPLLQLYFRPVVEQLTQFSQLYPDIETEEGVLVQKSMGKVCRLQCYVGHPDCIHWPRNLSSNDALTKALNPNYCHYLYYCNYLLQHGKNDDFNLILDLLRTNDSRLKGPLINAIVCAQNATVVEAVLAYLARPTAADHQQRQQQQQAAAFDQNAAAQHPNINYIPGIELVSAMTHPFTLLNNPTFYHILWRHMYKQLRKGSSTSQSASAASEASSTTQLNFEPLRWAITSPTDLYFARNIVAWKSENEFRKLERELEWMQYISPKIVSWLNQQLFPHSNKH